MTIRVGTLCIVVRTVFPALMGRTCVVLSYDIAAQPELAYLVRFPEVIEGKRDWYGGRENLLPIAPPGNPDRVEMPEREPAELLR